MEPLRKDPERREELPRPESEPVGDEVGPVGVLELDMRLAVLQLDLQFGLEEEPVSDLPQKERHELGGEGRVRPLGVHEPREAVAGHVEAAEPVLGFLHRRLEGLKAKAGPFEIQP
jgi:hypothetical protein